MKREIKFRGKSVDNNEWVYGDLIHIGNGCIIYQGSQSDYEITNKTGVAIELFDDEVSVVRPETLGQFTGLCDKNRKEIYEGDIINFTFHSDMTEHANLENRPEITRLQIVEFYDYRFVLHDFMLDKENVTCFNFPFSDKFRHRYEVAGNIYDNPELIK